VAIFLSDSSLLKKVSYFLFQAFIGRYCVVPVISQIDETIMIAINKMIRKISNSSSFSNVIKNEGCSSKNIHSPTARGAKIMGETERQKAITKVLLACEVKNFCSGFKRYTASYISLIRSSVTNFFSSSFVV
jgi:hypothetical protein